MKILNLQRFRLKRQNLFAASPLVLTCLILLVSNYGCVKKVQVETQLEIQNVQSRESNSLYKITGSTNLPESSRISVAAVRYLRPTSGQPGVLLNSNTSSKISILARQIVEVKQGKWEADLNLWQVAPDGRFEEVWQANQTQMKLTPESGVTFIATFNPGAQWEKSDNRKLEEKLQLNQDLEGKLVRFTNEGEKYAQASQTLLIPLPTGKTTPPRLLPEDINGGWGNRYQILPESKITRTTSIAPTKSRQTNASLLPSEFLR
ncbi:hypothetical protein H6G41_08055 [Tolypothrix sp. FACHB-123]|uniref:hypothetical protein n=1 Tax=Tolypothrix sp. FACHB-123 TaxID=2692868 RepID=UPI001681DAE3|nr:hypothetical protein [Tolypothrix sp. FACHB-123]MBD2354582.1 hypothetical protein [Tolypothrix sp. FACHB-123]